ncbi:universal stress protein [Latilactobacillus fuchuensis]|uniref:Universal stress protein n=1 Tax=Latilactobacillus fuchuensis TaxID=164393 RepID=A0A2N9DUD9_9LACO|nr:universal stress protein [Latilactobacillus fuchuensis]SPC37703.1 Universal stress protein [Latilactobacillus fuchuensis]
MTNEYKRILVGDDGSENAHRAIKEAVELTKRNRAELSIAMIIPKEYLMGSNYGGEDSLKPRQKAAAEKLLASDAAYAKTQGLADVQTIVRFGSPKKALAVTLPQELETDLIILGATGRGAIERAFLGSIAMYTSVHAEANMLLVR